MSFADITAALAARDGVLLPRCDGSSAQGGLPGAPAGQQLSVTADDGVKLHVEILDSADAGVTVVFCHGYLLDSTSWHVQRAMLAGKVRVVLWDLRGHGRSGWGTPPNATVDQLARDLFSVLKAAAPRGRVMLVGHSMGAMAILGLAESHPELFGERVIGVVLASTSAGGLSSVTVGLPVRAARILHRTVPITLAALRRQARLVDAARRPMGGLSFLLTSRYLFGTRVPESVAKVTTALMASVPIHVIAEFYKELISYDKRVALPTLGRVPVLVMVGERDLITPREHAEALASAIPGAELALIPGAGHLLTLERPIEINQHVWDLLTRAGGTTPRTDPMVVNRDGARRKPPTGVSPLTPSCPGQEVLGGEPPEPPPQAVAE